MELSKDEVLLPYTVARQQAAQINELSAALIAFVRALSETVPGFVDSYARHKRDSDASLKAQGSDAQLALLDRLIEKIRTR